ncbi:MAG: AmmeMemoRadiSam system protein B, partial [Armatimonadota bacterium]
MDECPKLRAGIEAFPGTAGGRRVVLLHDMTSLVEEPVAVPEDVFFILSLFDGAHSVREIQTAYARHFGTLVFSDHITRIVEEMDARLLLDSERFRTVQSELEREFRAAPVRAAACAGRSYESDPEPLRRRLDTLLESLSPADQKAVAATEAPVRALVAPHIDYGRGGRSYAVAHSALRHGCEAGLFVVLGANHFGDGARFALTEKDFDTPLGTVRTDKAFVKALADAYDGDAFEAELGHRNEHSIELQIVFLRHMVPEGDELSVVPILCGSFDDLMADGASPRDVPEIAGMIAALRQEMKARDDVCVIASADLAHIGRRFGDERPLTPGYLATVEEQDREMLDRAAEMDAEGVYRSIQKDGNARNVCGLA